MGLFLFSFQMMRYILNSSYREVSMKLTKQLEEGLTKPLSHSAFKVMYLEGVWLIIAYVSLFLLLTYLGLAVSLSELLTDNTLATKAWSNPGGFQWYFGAVFILLLIMTVIAWFQAIRLMKLSDRMKL